MAQQSVGNLRVRDLPIAANVCGQVLREVEKNPAWTMAHVTMNPMAASLLHRHDRTTEIYIVTRGSGELLLSGNGRSHSSHQVTAGSVCEIPRGFSHKLQNSGGGHLEHLVFALPQFDPNDVHLLDEKDRLEGGSHPLFFPEVEDCFDGAKILPYSFPHLGLSIAFGWVSSDPEKRKRPHYHNKTTEWVYVVGGRGFVQLGKTQLAIQPGDWIRIDPDTDHAFLNDQPEDLVVVCVCSPAFNMDDVLYQD